MGSWEFDIVSALMGGVAALMGALIPIGIQKRAQRKLRKAYEEWLQGERGSK